MTMNTMTQTHGLAPALPLAMAPADAARMAGVGRTKLYEAISEGELESVKIGKRRLVTVEALKAWLNANVVRVKRETGDAG